MTMSTSLARTEASLTPRMGGESKKMKSYRCFNSATISFICAEPRMLIEVLGSLPLAMKSSIGTPVVWMTSSSWFCFSR